MDYTLTVQFKLRRWVALSLIITTLLPALSGCFGLSGSTRSREQLAMIDSPQKDRNLMITVNTSRDDPTKYLTLVFEIRDQATQTVLHRQQTSASSRMAWSMRWLDNSLVQLSSSDVGTYCWQEQDDGMWMESPCP
mgnify:FL=1